MGREFGWVRPDGEWKIGGTLGDCMEAAKNNVPVGNGPYTLRKDGKKIRGGTRRWVLRGLERALVEGKVGPTYRVWDNDSVEFACREVQSSVHIIDINGNDKADKCWSYGKDEYPDVYFLGSYVCKSILGTSVPSQHSYGNADDFGRDTMAKLWDLAHFLVSKRAELDLAHVIVDDMIWTPAGAWGHYSGQRHYHVHADFLPQYSGSCGVRG